MTKRRQTIAGLVRERLHEFESEMARGILQEAIVADLVKEGHRVSLATFRTELHRARAKSLREPPRSRLEHHRQGSGVNSTEKMPKTGDKLHDQFNGFRKEDI